MHNKVFEALNEELSGSSSIIGYRAMHQRLLTVDHGLVIGQDVRTSVL